VPDPAPTPHSVRSISLVVAGAVVVVVGAVGGGAVVVGALVVGTVDAGAVVVGALVVGAVDADAIVILGVPVVAPAPELREVVIVSPGPLAAKPAPGDSSLPSRIALGPDARGSPLALVGVRPPEKPATAGAALGTPARRAVKPFPESLHSAPQSLRAASAKAPTKPTMQSVPTRANRRPNR
jgi:hypothetical protein